MPWTPVTDRLPPIRQKVLACSNLAATYHVAYLSPQDGKWHEALGGMTVHHITHWMPLPDLRQGGIVDEWDHQRVGKKKREGTDRRVPLPPPALIG